MYLYVDISDIVFYPKSDKIQEMNKGETETTFKQSVRIQKWGQIVKEDNKIDRKTLIQEVRLGIPQSIRMKVWEKILNMDSKAKHDFNYQELIKQESQSMKYINLDVKRTFPNDQDHQILEPSLSNLLRAISIAYPKVEYKSGMSFLAYRMLQVVNDETSFNIWVYLFTEFPYFRQFCQDRNTEKIKQIFKHLLKLKAPKLNADYQSIFSVVVVHFFTLCSYQVEKKFFWRIFDLFLVQGWSVIFSIIIQFLLQNYKQLNETHQKDFGQFFNVFKRFDKIENYQELIERSRKLNITAQQVAGVFMNYQKKQ